MKGSISALSFLPGLCLIPNFDDRDKGIPSTLLPRFHIFFRVAASLRKTHTSAAVSSSLLAGAPIVPEQPGTRSASRTAPALRTTKKEYAEDGTGNTGYVG